MAAVRVPPSAWITSQSIVICRSPSLGRSTTARSARPIRRWISCVRPEGWPTVDLAPRALVGGARQHAVLGRHPAAALALEPGRHALLEARRAVDVGIAELDQAGALGVHRHRALDRDAAKLVGLAFGGTHGAALWSWVLEVRRHPRRAAAPASTAKGAGCLTDRSGLTLDSRRLDDPHIPNHEHRQAVQPPERARQPVRAAEAQRALAHHLPADRRELSGHRRSGRLAQPVAPSAHDAVAGLDPQRHVGPGAPGPDLRAAHLGRPAADRGGPAHVRRRPARDRRPHRRRAPPDRGAAAHQAREVGRAGAERRRRDDLRPVALRRRGARRQAGEQAQAHRVRAARARQGAGRPGRRRPERREPGDRPARRAAAVEPDRRPPTTSTPTSAASPWARPGRRSRGSSPRPRPSSTS